MALKLECWHSGGLGRKDDRKAAEQPEMGPAGLPTATAAAAEGQQGQGLEDALQEDNADAASTALLVRFWCDLCKALFMVWGEWHSSSLLRALCLVGLADRSSTWFANVNFWPGFGAGECH